MMDNLEEALIYIKGYCEKHDFCKNGCRLYNSNTKQCFVTDGYIPADWAVEREGDKE